jgi:hypothetical protein
LGSFGRPLLMGNLAYYLVTLEESCNLRGFTYQLRIPSLKFC